MLISELNETELIAKFVPLLPKGTNTLLGPGDDCAIISAPENAFVVTTDIHVSGRHFREDWSSANEIGQRVAAQNLADVAAMGAHPTALVCSLVLPAHIEVDWLLDLVAGLGQRVGLTEAGVVGGDMSSGDTLVISITAHGECRAVKPVLRSGAKVGDVLAVAGTLGHSGAGLSLLLGDLVDPAARGNDLPKDLRLPLETYRAPNPPLRAGIVAAEAGAHAMLDLSDGLLLDGSRIAKASGVGIDLDSKLLAGDYEALSPVGELTQKNPWDWILTGGEDHSLLATFSPESDLPFPFRPIGRVTEDRAILFDGASPPVKSLGWDHFAKTDS